MKKRVEGECKNYDVELLPCWFFQRLLYKIEIVVLLC